MSNKMFLHIHFLHIYGWAQFRLNTHTSGFILWQLHVALSFHSYTVYLPHTHITERAPPPPTLTVLWAASSSLQELCLRTCETFTGCEKCQTRQKNVKEQSAQMITSSCWKSLRLETMLLLKTDRQTVVGSHYRENTVQKMLSDNRGIYPQHRKTVF